MSTGTIAHFASSEEGMPAAMMATHFFTYLNQYTNMTISIEQFIESFLAAVDFQEAIKVTPETELKSLPEWDSLAALGVIVMFDVEFGKTITGDDLKACSTIADLYKLLG